MFFFNRGLVNSATRHEIRGNYLDNLLRKSSLLSSLIACKSIAGRLFRVSTVRRGAIIPIYVPTLFYGKYRPFAEMPNNLCNVRMAHLGRTGHFRILLMGVNNKMPHSPRGEERLWGRFDISASSYFALTKYYQFGCLAVKKHNW